MKRFTIVILLIVSLFCISKIDVMADDKTKKDEPQIDFLNDGEKVGASCKGLFEQEGIDLIKEILGMVRIIGPCLVALLVALDFGSAVVSGDNDGLSKATKKIVPRLIAAGLLLIVPTLVRIILSVDGVQSVLVRGNDPLCNIDE